LYLLHNAWGVERYYVNVTLTMSILMECRPRWNERRK